MTQRKAFSILKKKTQDILFKLFNKVNPKVFYVILKFFEMLNKLQKKKRILIFTDSRGFEVTKPWNRKNPFSSYVGTLALRYSCRVLVCPEKFTSLVDFISYYDEADGSSFDHIILHCGIVDFAPRPESSFEQMFETKRCKLDQYSLSESISKNNREASESYEGEPTYSFLNKEALDSVILPRLINMPNLIYVGTSKVLTDWDGIYWRKRPRNINEQLKLDAMLCKAARNSIKMSELNDELIKLYTSDNVHYTNKGFNFILAKLEPILKNDNKLN